MLAVPAIALLFVWMIVPLALTLWYSVHRYNLQDPERRGFVGFDNYYYLFTDPSLRAALFNTLVLVGSDLAITVAFGVLLAVVFDQPFRGRSVARLLVITPFFVMPAVSALVWKNLLMHPVYGLFAWISARFGLAPVDWLADWPLTSIIIIVAWEWTPFAALIFLTSLQSLDREQIEAAKMDGARSFSLFRFIMLPHLGRTITIVVMLETIFFLATYAEIVVTTVGGPGLATTNLTFFIYEKALLAFDVGGASAAGVLAIVLANLVTIFFVRTIAKQL